MYKEILRSIAGIEVFPIISLCVFVTVFTLAVILSFRLDSARLSKLARLPLDGDADESTDKGALL